VERAAAVDQRTQVTAARMGKLVLIRADRTDGAVFPLYEGVNSFGRDDTDISFPQDDFLAPRHLDLLVEPDSVRVVPHTTVNGTFHRTKKSVRLASGAQFRIGQELLQVEIYDEVPREVTADGTVPLGAPIPGDVWGRLLVVVGANAIASAFLLQGEEVAMGREVGNITFPHDGYVSGRHAALRRATDGSVTLTDLGSSNGTYVRLSTETRLASGDVLLAGQQLFRVQV
jgi:pSer/pThr/pTyr-binding forkhead associated (FHA) protein